jgi:anaerobic selenocysteine-containing dehydrogenase
MAREPKHSDKPRLSGISRRDFIKIAAAAGLLTGCSSAQQPAASPTSVPTDTPPATSTPAPTATNTPIAAARWQDIIKIYPEVPSKVVHTHHAGVWDGNSADA